MERVAERVVARLRARPNAQVQEQSRYVREKEAAAFIGVSVKTLRSWRSKRPVYGPPVTRMGKMVLYSVKGLEEYMEERTVEGR
jgi:predicted DNA-binding transcriptional regulator AlpA